ncbi:MAG: glycerophosphodiester phosphodiesterase [Chloroflexota bacterium]|nr:glycerophosphodiester phosphodiesterase [Dehalococcoidia bacterium]MDW8252764.1 glycerophosphodiester phosphodiesterase [Chloroflexota bacterium]
MSRWRLIAHRGASAEVTENTLAAFDLAARHGADAVECDVRLTRDGVPVVFHDADLVRLAGRPERVDSLTAAEVAAVRLEGGHRIPTLAETLVWSRTGLPLIIEVKSGADPVLMARQVAAVAAAVGGTVAALSSFSPRLLEALAASLPEVPRALVADLPAEDAAVQARAVGAAALHLAVRRWTGAPPFEPTFVWTVDDVSAAGRLLGEGARGIFTNRPAALAALRGSA